MSRNAKSASLASSLTEGVSIHFENALGLSAKDCFVDDLSETQGYSVE